MRTHVVPKLHPNEIYWWLSLSGGKDSLCMAYGLRDWYEQNGYDFLGCGLHIRQWGQDSVEAISSQVPWLDVFKIEARLETSHKTGYTNGDQAPCRLCANVRRKLGDNLLHRCSHPRRVNVLARGLHLTDTTVSLLWRFADGRVPFADLFSAGKCFPLSELWQNTFLAKPLYYVREFETQEFAQEIGLKPVCCGCPACNFPSRRDLVEETLAECIRAPLWEFSVPGIDDLLRKWGGETYLSKVRLMSLPGKESKHPHLPPDFPEFALNHFRHSIPWRSVNRLRATFDDRCLDNIGMKRLSEHAPLANGSRLPRPKLFIPREEFTHNEVLCIVAFGPLWGAIGLQQKKKFEAFLLQKKLFGVGVDPSWSQVTHLLNVYYRRKYGSLNQTKNSHVCCVSAAGGGFCCT
jgi:tRNA(Ile)-lysidine synthase TilS/MesJ